MSSHRLSRLAASLTVTCALSAGLTAAATETPSRLEANHAADPSPLLRSFTDSEGATSTYQSFTDGVDFSKPTGVLIRLHGDDDFQSTTERKTLQQMAGDAADRNMILLAPRTPDRRGAETWWENSEVNSHWVRELLDTKYTDEIDTIDPANLNWSGYSGGAEFLSYELLVNNPEYITRSAVMFGGGGAPYWDFENTASQQQLQEVHLQWIVGENDTAENAEDGFDALTAAREGHAFYHELGYQKAELDVLPDRDHYNVDQAGLMEDFLDSLKQPRRLPRARRNSRSPSPRKPRDSSLRT